MIVRMWVEPPGARVPLTVSKLSTAEVLNIPDLPRVAPLATLTAVSASEPLMNSFPALTVVAPV